MKEKKGAGWRCEARNCEGVAHREMTGDDVAETGGHVTLFGWREGRFRKESVCKWYKTKGQVVLQRTNELVDGGPRKAWEELWLRDIDAEETGETDGGEREV